MNTTQLKETAKNSIDSLFNEMDELKLKAEQVGNNVKKEWDNELSKLETTKAELNKTYKQISKANEEAAQELTKAFNEQKASAEHRIEHLREIYSKMLN